MVAFAAVEPLGVVVACFSVAAFAYDHMHHTIQVFDANNAAADSADNPLSIYLFDCLVALGALALLVVLDMVCHDRKLLLHHHTFPRAVGWKEAVRLDRVVYHIRHPTLGIPFVSTYLPLFHCANRLPATSLAGR